MKRLYLIMITASLPFFCYGQDDLMDMLDDEKNQPVISTFKTTRIINSHSIETVKASSLDFRITHRFGDIASRKGGHHKLYGFDNVSDMRISFEVGVNEDLTIGLGRSKGAHIRELWDGYLKYRFLTQTINNKTPLSIAFFTNTAISGMIASTDSTSDRSFQKFAHRVSYTYQFIFARKFSHKFSLQLMPTYVHRNYVAYEDEKGLFAMGIGGRLKLTRQFGIIADYFYVLPNLRKINGSVYYDPLSIGIEIETGGHVFHINFTNSQGIIENEFVPHTGTDWLKGEFRFGFNISRLFDLFH